MTTVTTRNQLIIGVILALLLVTTRGHHFSSLHNLPSASWAIFFIAGFYLRQAWVLPALFGLAGALDFAAVTWGGVSNFCVSPAYAFLLPAYSALWMAGRWYSGKFQFAWSTLMPLFVAVFLGAAMCEVFSSGGFYIFSGRFAEPTFAEFGSRLVMYFPHSLQSVFFYVGITALLHTLFSLASDQMNTGKRHLA